jgi:Sulfatase
MPTMKYSLTVTCIPLKSLWQARSLRSALTAVLLAPLAALHAADVLKTDGKSQPNIVVIMADDLGWRDLCCYGNAKLDTPALDQLAADGMRFTDAYAASPVCTPTRAAMMTGQSPARLRITNHAPGNPVGFALKGSTLQEAENIRQLPLAATTIAERLAVAGYATAHIGKWHLSYTASEDRSRALISTSAVTPVAVRPVTSHPIASPRCRMEGTGNICLTGWPTKRSLLFASIATAPSS